MQLQLKHTNLTITVANEPFAGGGEGDLYRIKSPARWRNHVVKLYHEHKRSPLRQQKMQYLLDHPPGLLEEKHPTVVWPQDLVYREGVWLGIIMPFIKGKKLEVLCSAKLPPKLDAAWQRFALNEQEARQLRLRLCFNLATALYKVHQTGRYVLVDLKPDNVIVQSNGLVSLVDMDSVEVLEDGEVLFPAPVATPEYTPPEFYSHGRSEAVQPSWDLFSVAVIFYKLLHGIHPFAASALPPYDTASSLAQKIEHGLFAQMTDKMDRLHVIPPPHKRFEQLPMELQSLFKLAFEAGIEAPEVRPIAADWCLHLFHSINFSKEEQERLDRWFFVPTRRLALSLPGVSKFLPPIDYSIAKLERMFPREIQSFKTETLPNLKLNPPEVQQYDKIKTDTSIVVIFTMSGLFAFFIFIHWLFLFLPFLVFGLLILFNYRNVSKPARWQKLKNIITQKLPVYKENAAQQRVLYEKLAAATPQKVIIPTEIYSKIRQSVKQLIPYLNEQNKAIQQLQTHAQEQYELLNEEINQKLFNHPLIESYAPLKESELKIQNLSAVNYFFIQQQTKEIQALHKDFDWEEHQEALKKAKEELLHHFEQQKKELEKEKEAALQSLRIALNKKKERAFSLLKEEAHLKSNYYRRFSKPFPLLESAQLLIRDFATNHLPSILDIERINRFSKSLVLKNGKTISYQELQDQIPHFEKNLVDWWGEMKASLKQIQQPKTNSEKQLALGKNRIINEFGEKKIQLKKEQKQELHFLKNKLRKELEKPLIQKIKDQYKKYMEVIQQFSEEKEEREEALIKATKTNYELIKQACLDRYATHKQLVETEEKAYSAYLKSLFPDNYQDHFQSYIKNKKKLEEDKITLENVLYEEKRYEIPTFGEYIQLAFGIKSKNQQKN